MALRSNSNGLNKYGKLEKCIFMWCFVLISFDCYKQVGKLAFISWKTKRQCYYSTKNQVNSVLNKDFGSKLYKIMNNPILEKLHWN